MTIECVSESEVLHKYEIVEITRMLQKKKQIAWLRTNGWEFEVNGRGEPVVRREYARQISKSQN